jgi:hypothetical protein
MHRRAIREQQRRRLVPRAVKRDALDVRSVAEPRKRSLPKVIGLQGMSQLVETPPQIPVFGELPGQAVPSCVRDDSCLTFRSPRELT